MTDPEGDTAGVLRSAGIDTIVPLDSKERIRTGLVDFLRRIRDRAAPVATESMIVSCSRRRRTVELVDLLDSVV